MRGIVIVCLYITLVNVRGSPAGLVPSEGVWFLFKPDQSIFKNIFTEKQEQIHKWIVR